MKRLIIILLTVVVATLGWQACIPRYTLNGASIDYNVYKTISFGEFPIRAALVYPPLQSMFENRMTDMIAQQTRLRVIDDRNADLHMEGEIKGELSDRTPTSRYTHSPLAMQRK